jgi:S1-C subfamily serine protease
LALRELSNDEISSLGLQNGGLLITDVDDKSPAGDAGLSKDMVVTMIGNRQISDVKSLPEELLKMRTGTNVHLNLIIVRKIAGLVVQRGGSVMLTAR